jgi:hypothetical protein
VEFKVRICRNLVKFEVKFVKFESKFVGICEFKVKFCRNFAIQFVESRQILEICQI